MNPNSELASEPVLDPAIIVGHGARATEELLLRDLAQLLGTRPEGTVPARPIRIVLSSRPLRDHVAATISRVLPPARIGVVCQTLRSVALQILAAAGEETIDGESLIPLLARRVARDLSPLRNVLRDLTDGYATVVGTVSDLLDAGLDPALAEGLREALDEATGHDVEKASVERANAAIEVASRVAQELESQARTSRANLFQGAATALRQEGRDLIPSRYVLFHGWADATGSAADLIEALLNEVEGRVYLDQPDDPAAPGRADAGVRFTRRLKERLELTLPRHSDSPASHLPSELFGNEVSDIECEARAAAQRIHELLCAAARPEGIAVVARDLLPYRAHLRTHLHRLGIPFSAPFAPGPLLPLGRTLAALTKTLVDGSRTEVALWIELLAPAVSRRQRALLGLVFSASGAARLESAAAVDVSGLVISDGNGSIAIPRAATPSSESNEGAGEELEEDDFDEKGEGTDDRPGLAVSVLREAVGKARLSRGLLDAWTDRIGLAMHRSRLEDLLRGLGWRSSDELWSVIASALDVLEESVPPGFPIDRDELALLLARELEEKGRQPWGGAGAGVKVLSALHARSLTFDHLLLLGVNRGTFPRAISEDPLFPDPLRKILAASGAGPLPDLPRKLEGSIEERYLFAELLSSAPDVYVSWHAHDDESKPLSPSPLLSRLQLARPAPPADGGAQDHPSSRCPRPAFESAIHGALDSGLGPLASLLPIAIQEAAGFLPNPAGAQRDAGDVGRARRVADDSGNLARFRLAVLREFEGDSFNADSGSLPGLGPFHGLVGRQLQLSEGDLYVTTLEAFSRCPWRVFLERLLRVEPVPDPLASLPGLDPIWVGVIVHRVLEKWTAIATSAGHSLDEIGENPGEAVAWMGDDELERLLHEETARLLRQEGAALPGLAALLAAAARGPLAVARKMDWPEGEVDGVLAAEMRGSARFSGSPPVLFRADRVDRLGQGLLLTDYKTGRPLATQKTEKGRRDELRRRIARGENLQAAAYSRAAGSGGRGRYLFLRPDPQLDASQRVLAVEAEDEELQGLADEAVQALVTAWAHGDFFPRLTEPNQDKEPSPCRSCPVSEACIRGDTSMRRQLFAWGQRALTEPWGMSPAADLWRLPAAKGDSHPTESADAADRHDD